MRWFLPCAILILAVQGLRAQDQEQKLVDRLLRPNTELRNTSQAKQFVADGAPVTKHATVSAFHWQEKSNAKSFSGTRDFSTQDFNSHPFYAGNDRSKFRTQPAGDFQKAARIPESKASRTYRDSGKSTSTSDYPGNRAFLDKGKSQKALDQKREEMSIDDVRKLLNKS